MRNTVNPNKRVQDGLKLHWLCSDCESLFGKDETAFASKIFYPWNAGETTTPYDEWMLRFCVSVSWRVLKYCRGRNPAATYTSQQLALMDQAEVRWRAFLNRECEHPGDFEQHVLFFDIVESTSFQNLPKNFNRFMTGAVTLDIVGSTKSIMTFAKMGKFIVFGIVQHGKDKWINTRVRVKKGVLKPDRFTVPAGLMDLFKEKAKLSEDAINSVSEAQFAIIDQTIFKDVEKFKASDQFRAIVADAEMFGPEAVVRKPYSKSEKSD